MTEGRAGEFSVLLLWALDRLSREGPLEMLKAVDSFGKAGVRVISYEEPWTEASNEMLDLLLAILAGSPARRAGASQSGSRSEWSEPELKASTSVAPHELEQLMIILDSTRWQPLWPPVT
jgi:hypothetical protein